MTICEKAAYLKGLMDGMDLDTEKAEGKMIAAIVDLLGDMAKRVKDIEETTIAISDELDEIEEDLDAIEDFIMDEEDEDWDDEEDEEEDWDDECDCEEGFEFGDEDSTIYEVECPACGRRTSFDTPWFDSGREKYLALAFCPQHGMAFCQMHFKRVQSGTLVMHQRAYAADDSQIADTREKYRLYQLTPPRKRHHRLSMQPGEKPEGAK
jgi:Mg2+ and Co2+ transporter CorA